MCLKSEQAFESFFGQAGMSLPSAILYAKSCSKFNLFTLPSSFVAAAAAAAAVYCVQMKCVRGDEDV